jgi:hypothetical protein
MTEILTEIERQRKVEQARAWDRAELVLTKRTMDRCILEATRRNKLPDAIAEVNAEPSQAMMRFGSTSKLLLNVRGFATYRRKARPVPLIFYKAASRMSRR